MKEDKTNVFEAIWGFKFSFLFSVSVVIEYLEEQVLQGWRELVDDQLQ